MNWKTNTAGGAAAITFVAGFIADAPPSLQNQIPQLFPEQYRGSIALYLHFATALAIYALAHFAKDRETPPPAPAITNPPV